MNAPLYEGSMYAYQSHVVRNCCLGMYSLEITPAIFDPLGVKL
jgi:hypothetical protein